MRKILPMIPAILSLSACTPNQSFTGPQYSIELIHLNDGGGRLACHKRLYEVSKDRVGALTKFQEVKPEECDKVIGYHATDYSALWALMEYVRKQIPQMERFIPEVDVRD